MANVYADTETVSTFKGYTWRDIFNNKTNSVIITHLMFFQTRVTFFLLIFCGTQMEMLHRIFSSSSSQSVLCAL